MEESGRGAAVEQLTARGTEYQSPQWGVIVNDSKKALLIFVSIPAMGGNRNVFNALGTICDINPRDGGQ